MNWDHLRHGEFVKSHGRWCLTHKQFHGQLYACEAYPESLLEEIEQASEQYVANLRSKAWCKNQVEQKKIPVDGIEILRAMAGIEYGDWIE